VLIFLLPFMVAYEVGAILYLTKPGMMETIGAHRIVVRLFESLGGVVWHAPTLLLAAILLVWHLLLRESWKVKPSVLLGMAFESCLWTLPVLVLGLLENATLNMGGGRSSPPPAAMAEGVIAIRDQPWQALATLSIGAGLYEELLFRLILLTLLHIVLVDMLKVKDRWGSILAAVASGVLFALYHDLPMEGRPRLVEFLFYTVVGTYFGALFLIRGLGVVVAVHAIYDIVVLVALNGPDSK
jgi:membrane protease YdiL (CAAX protease family)